MKLNRKLNVALLVGGNSPEHDVSLASGRNITSNIDKTKYNLYKIVLSRSGKDDDLHRLIELNKANKIDIVFIAIHGSYGEDGTIQKKLDKTGFKYTGSGYKASKLGMDKLRFKRLMKLKHIEIPKHIVYRKGDSPKRLEDKVSFPCFVKPTNQGSSVGVNMVKDISELDRALRVAQEYDKLTVIEEYIKGTEITVPVMGNKRPYALPVIEIRPKKCIFFDYVSKYTKGGSEEIVPAKITPTLTKKVQKLAVRIYKFVGCRGFARTDFIIRNDNPVVLEINTIPGLTSASLFPKSAKTAGLSFTKLIDKIINYALE